MRQILICQLLCVTALATARGHGQTNAAAAAPPAVTPEALVAEALTTNPELRFFEAELAAARAGRVTAGVLANPELSGDVGRKSVDDTAGREEGVAWSVSVVQPFEWPGRIGLRKAIANRDIELAELGLARFRTALTGRVRLLAFELQAARETASAAREVAGRLTALREVLVQREPAGLTPLLETRVIEATEIAAQRRAGEATLAERSALLELNALRGAALDYPLRVTETPLRFPPVYGTEDLLAAARTNNFEIRVRAVELAQQGFRVDLAKNERFPAIAVAPSISEERAGERERVISIGISAPLPLWDRNTGNIQAAQSRQLQAEISLTVAQREVDRLVTEAVLTYDTKVREMALWRPDAIRQFREAAEIADRHYRLGAVPIATFIELQSQYLEAVEALLATRKEAVQAAQQLEWLTGLPSPWATAEAQGGTK